MIETSYEAVPNAPEDEHSTRSNSINNKLSMLALLVGALLNHVFASIIADALDEFAWSESPALWTRLSIAVAMQATYLTLVACAMLFRRVKSVEFVPASTGAMIREILP